VCVGLVRMQGGQKFSKKYKDASLSARRVRLRHHPCFSNSLSLCPSSNDQATMGNASPPQTRVLQLSSPAKACF
jgi:hypothetical protein